MLGNQTLPVTPCNTVGFRLIFALALMIVSWLTLTPSPGALIESVNDKAAHAAAFLVLAFLAHGSWPNHSFDWKFFIPLALYGALLEGLQYFIPGRYFSMGDLFADWIGIVAYLLLLPQINRLLDSQRHPAP